MVPGVALVLGLGTWAHFAPRSLGAMVPQEVALNQQPGSLRALRLVPFPGFALFTLPDVIK